MSIIIRSITLQVALYLHHAQPTVDRIYILNTLFHMPEIFILALMVDYFDNNPSYVRWD